MHRYLASSAEQGSGCGAQIDDKLFFKLQLHVGERLRDVNPRVQLNAIRAAALLQSPRDKYCPVVNAFADLLKRESLTDVKLLLVDLIAINNTTFELFKNELVYDTDRDVRLRVLTVLERKVREIEVWVEAWAEAGYMAYWTKVSIAFVRYRAATWTPSSRRKSSCV